MFVTALVVVSSAVRRMADVPAARPRVSGARSDRLRRVRAVGSVRAGRLPGSESVHAGHRGDAQSYLGRDVDLQRRPHLRHYEQRPHHAADRRRRGL